MLGEAFGVIEGARVPEADGPIESRVDRHALSVGQRRRRSVGSELHRSRARLVVDALDVEQQARAVGAPAHRLVGEPALHARRRRQREAGHVIGG